MRNAEWCKCCGRLASVSTKQGTALCERCVPGFEAAKKLAARPARVVGMGIDAEMFRSVDEIREMTQQRAVRMRGFTRPPTSVWSAGKDSGIEQSWDLAYPDPRNER